MPPLEFRQRVGLFGYLTYSCSEPGQLKAAFQSPTKKVQRTIDLRFLNPNPVQERIIAFRPILLGLLFLGFAFLWGVGGFMKSQESINRVAAIVIGVLCLTVCLTVFYTAYLRSREVKAFLHALTGRGEVILYLNRENQNEVDRFTGELISQIQASQKSTPPPQASPPDKSQSVH